MCCWTSGPGGKKSLPEKDGLGFGAAGRTPEKASVDNTAINGARSLPWSAAVEALISA